MGARRAGHRPGLSAVGATICVALLAGCAAGGGPSRPVPSSPLAAGARVFQDGIGLDGSRIARIGGVAMPMAGDGCAACHGTDGRGHATMMVAAPDITYGNLTDPAGMLETDGTRGPVYTDALIRRAVIAGVGADGDELDRTMPRWQLSEQAWTDLLAYLKTL
jgi:Cytochrome c